MLKFFKLFYTLSTLYVAYYFIVLLLQVTYDFYKNGEFNLMKWHDIGILSIIIPLSILYGIYQIFRLLNVKPLIKKTYNRLSRIISLITALILIMFMIKELLNSISLGEYLKTRYQSYLLLLSLIIVEFYWWKKPKPIL